MTQLWSFDLGEASGVVLGSFHPDAPYEPVAAWQIDGGAQGLKDFLENKEYWRTGGGGFFPPSSAIAVCEKFILNPGNEFQADLEGVIGEGVLLAKWNAVAPIIWQPRSKKFMGYGETTTKRADEILKAGGLWQEPPPNHEDARDVNDALIHALVYLRDQRHVPTLSRYFRNED